MNIFKAMKYYLPTIVWLAIIYYFSSVPSLRYSEDNFIEIILRKGAHFFEYGVATLLVWNVFYNFHKISAKKSIIFSFLFIFLYASSDEIHQSFISGRSGMLIDVIYDSLSALLILEFILMNMFKKSQKIIFIFILTTIVILAGIGYKMISEVDNKTSEDKKIDVSEEIIEIKKVEQTVPEKIIQKELPNKIFVNIPFTSQAPFANWDDYHEEACEEASLVMLKYYLDKKSLTKDIAEEEIQKMIAFQIKNYGDYRDTTAEETIKLASDFYGIDNLKVVYDFKKEDIKKELSKGKPIIIPAAGRLLGNPNFTSPGPLYHNLVLVGYNGNTIITNDPGTKKGEGYKYDIDVLYNAIHDFPGQPEDIGKGRKAMIVLE